MFGQLGPLEWQTKDGQVKYRVGVNSINIDDLCNNIKIVYDKGENPKLKEAQELISKADRVFFLGFGYAEENLDALGFPDTFVSSQHVFGTALGFTEREITGITSLFLGKANKSSAKVIIDDLDCLAFLRTYL